MWLEAILSKDDLTSAVGQLLPLTIHLGNGGDGSLVITDPGEITLVDGVGLRIVCKAKLHWPVLGIEVPVGLNSVTVMLRPEISKHEGGESLVFKLFVEQADFAGIPTFLDTRITEKVNREIVEKRLDLPWNFTKTLSHSFALPDTLAPMEAIELVAAWGDVKVTAEAMVLVVSFQSRVRRGGDRGAEVAQQASA